MINFINPASGQINLENTVWMFNSEFATFYNNRYDFVKFNNNSEIEYLDGQGNLIRKDTLQIDKNGKSTIENNPFFKGIEFINPNEINIVIEGEYYEDEKLIGMRDMKFNLLKLNKTKIETSKEKMKILMNNSDWELTGAIKGKKKVIRFSTWKHVSKEEINRILEDSRLFLKHKKTSHLIEIENSVILVRQRLNMVDSKAIITKISEDEIEVQAENKNWVLKRIK